MMAVGEAYRVRTSPGLFTQNVIQPRTTRIPAERLSSDLREWGTFEFTVVQTTAEGGEKAHVMRRIA